MHWLPNLEQETTSYLQVTLVSCLQEMLLLYLQVMLLLYLRGIWASKPHETKQSPAKHIKSTRAQSYELCSNQL